MLSGGELPEFTIVDALTVRYSWNGPEPGVSCSRSPAPSPLYIYMPAHYMKQFHIKYADRKKLEAASRREGVSDWSALHTRMGRMYRDQNPDLPVLEPWHNTTADATQRAVFRRNPYFHRVDPAGRQLPYIDQVVADFGSTRDHSRRNGGGPVRPSGALHTVRQLYGPAPVRSRARLRGPAVDGRHGFRRRALSEPQCRRIPAGTP